MDELAPVTGSCAEGWEVVADALRSNFAAHGELGANLCVIHNGRTVVDLAGGWFDDAHQRAYDADDMVLVFSTTKGMTAACAHLLADRGELDLDAPVSRYWPEYAANGKAQTTVAMLLDHSAGVPGFREPLKDGAYLDWDYMVDRIAREAPHWEPGIRCGYHALNFGWAVGEVVRRVSGRSLGTYFREEVARPIGADCWIGLPEAEEGRTAELVPTFPDPGEPVIEVYSNLVDHPTSISGLAFTNNGGFSPAAVDERSGQFIINTRAMHAAENGSAGGIASARGIAKLYQHLGDESLLSSGQIDRLAATSAAAHRDPVLLISTRFGAGFMKSIDNRRQPLGDICSFLIGRRAFGHVGAGGSFGFYDPEAKLSIGYAMRRLGKGILLDERGQSIVDAAYATLGYASNATGAWIR